MCTTFLLRARPGGFWRLGRWCCLQFGDPLDETGDYSPKLGAGLPLLLELPPKVVYLGGHVLV